MQIEQLIPLIIILLASTLFGKKKKKGSDPKQTNPSTDQSQQSGPMRKIKEMSKEMYEEIQREIKEDPRTTENPRAQEIREMQEHPRVQDVQRMQEKAKSHERQRTSNRVPNISSIENSIQPLNDVISTEFSRTKTPKERPNRRTVAARKTLEKKQLMSSSSIVPKNRNDFIKGIVFSEIYGPPISKR
ncbi:hypothetical protein ACFSFY_00355 [Sporosarcina siberiensis]|uniref:Uncharacterized protein n=1 Tax=Sporosarcina siberiensis TaxID=1365606 RepID=A0ABW4SC89_9BACL